MIIPLIIANGNFISILFNLSVFWEIGLHQNSKKVDGKYPIVDDIGLTFDR